MHQQPIKSAIRGQTPQQPYTTPQNQYYLQMNISLVPPSQQTQPQPQYSDQSYGNSQFSNPVNNFHRVNNYHSPVLGNPTPPLTPASNMTYMSPTADMKSSYSEPFKQHMPNQPTTPVSSTTYIPPTEMKPTFNDFKSHMPQNQPLTPVSNTNTYMTATSDMKPHLPNQRMCFTVLLSCSVFIAPLCCF